MLDKRQRRKFEQKAAKETKAHWGLVFRHGYSVGSSATLGFPIVLDALGVWPKRRCPYQRVGKRTLAAVAAR
jgi:hypothetical protein